MTRDQLRRYRQYAADIGRRFQARVASAERLEDREWYQRRAAEAQDLEAWAAEKLTGEDHG
jgi:hypothetical protein